MAEPTRAGLVRPGEEYAALIAQGAPDPAQLGALYARYQSEVVGGAPGQTR